MPRFVRRAAIVAALFGFASHAFAQPQSLAELERGFATPPAAAKPMVFWQWMNGHVSREGITLDLEAMARVGVGGAIIFDGGAYLPAGPAGYLSPQWRELMTHALREGKRVGVDIGLHNAPGWSSSGGPWVTPERAMQQLTWSETTVRGGARVEVALPQPPTSLGFYRDAMVVAFPALSGEETPQPEQIHSARLGSGAGVSPVILSDNNLATSVALTPQSPLELEFAEPIEARAITVLGANGRGFPALRIEASADGKEFHVIGSVRNPGKHGIQPPGVANLEPVRAKFFRIVPGNAGEIGELWLHRTPRIEEWNFKANFAFRPGRQIEIPTPQPGDAAVDPARVVDLTAQFDARTGKLTWNPPAGVNAWTILRVGYTPTGQLNVSASAAGTGLEIDKMNRAATEFHFEHVVGRILADAGPELASALKVLAIDSYEAGMQNWTADFAAEFRRRAGYELRNYVPALFGRIVGDAARSERFLYDFRRVQADLMTENYYGRMGELARARGLTFFVEGYGQAVFDELQVSGLPDVPTTEFWQRTPWSPSRVVKVVASAAHTYGKPVVASEAFTGEEQTSRWLEYPYSLKALGDLMFSFGVNEFVFHRYAHQPHPTAVPGMGMGPWGFHFDRTNTWFEQSRGWLSYLTRAQFVLRQGAPVADVLYFVGERPPNVAQYAIPVLPAGYNYDLVNAEVLLTRASVRDGKIVLPEGTAYRVLLLPPNLKGVTPELARKLRDFAQQGATIVGPKPEYSLTLRGFPESDAEVRRIADELWGAVPTVGPALRAGLSSSDVRGLEVKTTSEPRPARRASATIDQRPIADALRETVAPDFEYVGAAPDAAVSWAHRSLPDAEVYFVANRQRRTDEIVGVFRVSGRQPELWNAETGARVAAPLFTEENGRTRVPLRLGPSESLFVVFRAKPPGVSEAPAWLTRDGARVIDATRTAAPRATEMTNTFTMSFWAKPDIDLRLLPRESTTGKIDETSKFYAIVAGEGDVEFGAGHVRAGVAVGRNGVYVVERASTSSPAVLVARMPIAGWTHFAIVYREGKPRLFVNGKFVREGLASGRTVHPGIGSPPPSNGTTYNFNGLEAIARASGVPSPPSLGVAYYFEGNMSPPELAPRALNDDEIAAEAARGLPATALPRVPELAREADGKIRVQVWQSGSYALDRGAPKTVTVAAPREITGPWRVQFQPGRGAPAQIELPQLMPLERQTDPGVRYFSGTASYTCSFDVPAEFLRANRRVVLDLGRVEVAAEVRVNGRDCGLAWKEPYRLDITGAAHAGTNTLEVRVTNLWANRLIGDEQLPAENEYAAGGEHGIRRVPDWYLRGEPKPSGGRVTFTTWKFYSADEPLVASGLLGPVRLLNPVQIELTR